MAIFPDRREFLAGSLASFGVADQLAANTPPSDNNPVAFFLVGDSHFFANKEKPGQLDERSALVTSRLVKVLNRLPGYDIPDEAGGGKVLTPSGVIHAGDCIDTGDKADTRMQETEWAAFAEAFGLDGKDGKLRYPVYEVHGNHDSPRGDGLAVRKIIERNKKRPGISNVSNNGVHYSWDWGNIHFINLGLIVGQVASETRKRRYGHLNSLEFLISDLKIKVGNSGRPVVITHHVDVLRYSQKLPVADEKAMTMEWDPADVKGFFDALHGYNIAAILYGHTHGRNIFRWNGSSQMAEKGIPVFNVTKCSHYLSRTQGFFYFEIGPKGNLKLREYLTDDVWETGHWTPQVWETKGFA